VAAGGCLIYSANDVGIPILELLFILLPVDNEAWSWLFLLLLLFYCYY